MGDRQLLALLVVVTCTDAHVRAPRPPASPASVEAGSGDSGSSAAPSPPLPAALCNMVHLERGSPLRVACTLTPTMMFAVSEAFREARQDSLWRHVSIASLGALLLLILSWLLACLFWPPHGRSRQASRRQGRPEANEGYTGIKVVYLRPDAWPMHVINPGDQNALTVPIEEPVELLSSEFIPTSWVQMEPPPACSSWSSPSCCASTSSGPTSPPARPAHIWAAGDCGAPSRFVSAPDLPVALPSLAAGHSEVGPSAPGPSTAEPSAAGAGVELREASPSVSSGATPLAQEETSRYVAATRTEGGATCVGGAQLACQSMGPGQR